MAPHDNDPDPARSRRPMIIGVVSGDSSQHVDATLSSLEETERDLAVVAVEADAVRAANELLGMARKQGKDIVVLAAGVRLSSGTIEALRSAADTDHRIGFVSPRFGDCQAAGAAKSHMALAERRDVFSFVPLPAEQAVYIKWTMLKEFGVLDASPGSLGVALCDLVMRANRCGYRAAIANRAFSAAQGRPQDRAQIVSHLRERYPELPRMLEEHHASATAYADHILDALVPDAEGKLDIGLDFTNFEKHHNGTFEAALKMLAALLAQAAPRYKLVALCDLKVFAFHGLGDFPGLERRDPEDAIPLAAIIRVGPFFQKKDLERARLKAAVLVTVMLDPIAVDCGYVRTPALDRLWQRTLDTSDLVVFNSSQTLELFRQRYHFAASTAFIPMLHSTDVREYGADGGSGPSDSGYLFLVGNALAHKFVREAADLLRAGDPEGGVVVLGLDGESVSGIKYVASGNVRDEEVRELYRGARAVVFPSHYEGFGFPLMHALAAGKPVFARDLPVYREIAARCPEGRNIHLFETTEEIVAAALADKHPWLRAGGGVIPRTWGDTATELLAAIEPRLDGASQRSIAEKLRALDPAPARFRPQQDRRAGEIRRKLLAARGAKPDVLDALLRAIAPRLADRRLVAASPLFDAQWYRATYKDVAAAGVDPLLHYMETGWKEGRNPSEWFDSAYYVEQDESSCVSSQNPLAHFLRTGVHESRLIRTLAGDEIDLRN